MSDKHKHPPMSSEVNRDTTPYETALACMNAGVATAQTPPAETNCNDTLQVARAKAATAVAEAAASTEPKTWVGHRKHPTTGEYTIAYPFFQKALRLVEENILSLVGEGNMTEAVAAATEAADLFRQFQYAEGLAEMEGKTAESKRTVGVKQILPVASTLGLSGVDLQGKVQAHCTQQTVKP